MNKPQDIDTELLARLWAEFVSILTHAHSHSPEWYFNEIQKINRAVTRK